jgi:hypothetical protein
VRDQGFDLDHVALLGGGRDFYSGFLSHFL